MTEERYPSQKLDQYMLRLPDGMRDRIKAAAAQNGRSMNAEIVAVLEERYPATETLDVFEFNQTWIERIVSEINIETRREIVNQANLELQKMGVPPSTFMYRAKPNGDVEILVANENGQTLVLDRISAKSVGRGVRY